jgi:prolyl oligopeptidase
VRIDADAGHGVGSTRDQFYAELADAYGFILQAAGDPAFQPK